MCTFLYLDIASPNLSCDCSLLSVTITLFFFSYFILEVTVTPLEWFLINYYLICVRAYTEL